MNAAGTRATEMDMETTEMGQEAETAAEMVANWRGAGRPSLEEAVRRAEEWVAEGRSSSAVVDELAKAMGEKRGWKGDRAAESPWMEGLGAEAVHPWRLAESDVNGISRLCRAIHAFGVGRMRTCRRMLENPRLFGKGVRVAAWMEFVGLSGKQLWMRVGCTGGRARPGNEVLWEWARLQRDGGGMERCRLPDAGAGEWLWEQDLRNAFHEDRPEEFEVRRTLAGHGITRRMLASLIRDDDGTETTVRLIGGEPQALKVFPAAEMLLYTCAWCANREKAVRLVEALCGMAPECGQAVDGWGLTPLDYTLWDWGQSSGPDGKLEQALVRAGCDPHHENRYGISYADIREAQTRQEEAERQAWREERER